MSDCISYEEAAVLLGVRKSKLYELHAAGLLGGHTVGRSRIFSRSGCLAFVERNRAGLHKEPRPTTANRQPDHPQVVPTVFKYVTAAPATK